MWHESGGGYVLTRAPAFWWKKRHPLAVLLSPLSFLYGYVAGRRMRHAVGAFVDAPVICVGNYTVGGTGKTPLALALAETARSRGLTPGFVLRGFGSGAKEAVLVEPQNHGSADVGDEALMLAAHAPVAVSPHRVDAAQLLIAQGVDLIIMDDGLQSRKLEPDLAIAVLDGRRGFGNGLCLPAGPLRAPLSVQTEKTDVLVINNGVKGAVVAGLPAAIDQVQARTRIAESAAVLNGQKVLAFAGIGDPEKFFASVSAAGADIVVARALADHQNIGPDLARALIDEASAQKLALVTTAKDYARMTGSRDAAVGALRDTCFVLSISTVFDDPAAPAILIDRAVTHFRQRQSA